jgi:hypothetical protein
VKEGTMQSEYEQARSRFMHPTSKLNREIAKQACLIRYRQLRESGFAPYQAMTMIQFAAYEQQDWFITVAAERYAKLIAQRAMYRAHPHWRVSS